jgi:hypothetical protein
MYTLYYQKRILEGKNAGKIEDVSHSFKTFIAARRVAEHLSKEPYVGGEDGIPKAEIIYCFVTTTQPI